MHYGNLVIIPAKGDVKDLVDAVMEPYNEELDDEGEKSFWDWYQIGGRWTGSLDGYDPETNPLNIELCGFCESGITTEAVAARFPAYRQHVGKTCIQCKGAGSRPKWPTQFVDHPGDIQPISILTDELLAKFYRVVSAKEVLTIDEGVKFGEGKWAVTADEIKTRYPNSRIVVVDNHS